jgi:hypothetical protein
MRKNRITNFFHVEAMALKRERDRAVGRRGPKRNRIPSA